MSGALSGAETDTYHLALPPHTVPSPPRTNTSGESGLPQAVNNTGYSVCSWNNSPLTPMSEAEALFCSLPTSLGHP